VIFEVQEQRMLVISDLHLGNPSSTARGRLIDFLEEARAGGWGVCINGDGFDLLQSRARRLASDAVTVMGALCRHMESGHRAYYVVGNHDIQLEHFLERWIFTAIVPFLNVRSGDGRIRIEHGHLYDPWYARSPGAYEVLTRVAGIGRFVVADAYALFARSQAVGDRRSRRSGETAEAYRRGAETVLERGFDTVVFGHTHRADDVSVRGGRLVNCGNWMRDSTYVRIDHGDVSLARWQPGTLDQGE
jgi:UDP-2,3-diacylglucosamine pyrophosphatase LpxH